MLTLRARGRPLRMAGLATLLVAARGIAQEAGLPPPREVVALVQAGRHEEAEALLRQGQARGRRGPAVDYLLGHVLLQQFRYPEAEAALRQALAARPDRAAWQHALGEALLGQGHCAAALEPLARAVALDPRTEYRHDLAACAQNVGSFGLAERELRAVLEAEPTSVPALFALGRLLADRGEASEARRLLERAVAREPAHAEAWFRLGLAAAAEPDPAAAIAAFRRVRAQAPGHVGAAYNLGRLLLANGSREEGQRVLAEVPALGARQEQLENRLQHLQLDPRRASTRLEAGEMLLEVGRLEEAREQLEAARALEPRQARTHLRLADVYRRLGLAAAAQQAEARAAALAQTP